MRRTFIVFFATILLILSFAHLVVYEGLVLFLDPHDPAELLSLRVGMVLLAVSFVIANIYARNNYNAFSRTFYRLSAVWLGFLLYFFIASIFYFIAIFTIGPSTTLGAGLFSAAILVSLYGIYNAFDTKERSIVVRISGLPKEWQGRKALFAADLHLGQIYGKGLMRKLARIFERSGADILLIGGDAYDGIGVDAESVIEPLSHVHPRLGKFFITGNHEEFADPTRFLDALRGAGFKVLLDEKVELEGMQLVGVDYQTTTSEEGLKEVLAHIGHDKTRPSILLKHVPLHVRAAAEAQFSLMLSGHTHKAQVFPFSLLTSRMFDGFDYGLKRMHDLQVYTTSGMGSWGPPLRVGTHSEVVHITFEA